MAATTVVAARLPVDEAEPIKQYAEKHGLLLSHAARDLLRLGVSAAREAPGRFA